MNLFFSRKARKEAKSGKGIRNKKLKIRNKEMKLLLFDIPNLLNSLNPLNLLNINLPNL